MIKRRRLVVSLGTCPLSWLPFGAFAQLPSRPWRVGFLAFPSRPASLDAHVFGGFPRGLRELGYIEGKNLTIEWRFADGQRERLDELAAELVQSRVDVIVTSASAATLAAQRATATIPIVFAAVSDPVDLGLAGSLARPGGNLTGRANLTGDLDGKRLEWLLGMLPRISRLAVLIDSNGARPSRASEILQAGARERKVTLVRTLAGTPQEIDSAFAHAARERAGALIVSFTPLFNQQRSQIAELARRHRLPTIAGDRGFVQAGCLMSYGASLADDFHGVAGYVVKVLNGAKPGDLPIEQPTRFELVINRKTARTLGLSIPDPLLLQANEVID